MAARQIERAVLLNREDIDTINAPFVTKGRSDPLIKAFGAALRKSAPEWLRNLSPDGDTISTPRLEELRAGIERRRALIDLLPDGEEKDANLAPLSELEQLVRELLGELDGGIGESVAS
ncbi:hypothetical protein QM616_22495 [Rhodococcus fascians]|uniref:hypothetical protein n=1 Tax=Rhodococcoides fascians TaxID=1828 RepID=UPI0024B7F08D|nr:hypothetical protein [Rhodococcus fascians]MDJ0005497.1 hypothetical protein [Rhodococcus fascians]